MKCGPLVIVGQARSGSTLLTRLLADTGHFLLVNDAYFLQMADDICPQPVPTPEQALSLGEACLQRIRDRALTDEVQTVNRSVPLNEEQFAELQAELPEIVSGAATAWEVIFSLMESASRKAGTAVWGWNSPQDYVHGERLLAALPESRVLFLIRNPYGVLKSYKNLPDYWGAERNRYHPLVQSLVWKAVVREYERLQALYPGRVSLMRYEDLAAGEADLWTPLESLLGTFPIPRPASTYDRNSSFGRKAAKPLSRMETGICRAVTGPLAARMGYGDAPAAEGGLGVLDLTRSTARFLGFYSARAAASRDMRRRLTHFGSRLWQRAR